MPPRTLIHLLLHVLVPAAAARLQSSRSWRRAWFEMQLGLVIDLDHLLADPIFDPGRCSVGFHPLHGGIATGVYVLLTLFPRTRFIGAGLLIHIVLDLTDCWWMGSL